MEIINAIILGIIQGLTEFLPVSSSGHLEIVKELIGQKNLSKESMLMTVVLHFATALSTIVVFKKEISEVFSGLFEFKNNAAFRFSLKILISMIPATIAGLFFIEKIESLFGKELTFVAFMLIITGLVLLLADKTKPSKKNVGTLNALIIGMAQAIAILPGISRSGATVATSVLLGIDKEHAARFSFLMVVPLIIGKMIQDIFSGQISYQDANFLPLIVGFIVAFLTGFFACRWMIKLVKRSQLKYFGVYCMLVGGIILLSYSF